ncbi:ABC-type transport auxiliary lipoprotein family protein [Ramlibacter tataouinensis]|uniref:ABC-type transport auxiliary lipoprotein family protein n=1 Tax=Ramlibacter tataouinensis TaxID=94132 RepID=UPI0022F3982B|nr:ABC-type transport auxiliary lipoprotein family protein [Ramlibacter tataouinensis]WBY00267.1 ABC-type transport auxiliary lipoprotein family protein [Ramlibacter tataouinensis]
MTIRILARAAAALSLLLLAACASIVDKPVRPTLFDMGPLPPITPPIERSGQRFALVVPEIDAAGALEGSAILYRLGYSDDHQLRAYSQSRWSAPPPQLVRQRLRQQLGRERPVLNLDESASLAREAAQPLYLLRMELEEFAHVFDEPASSRGVIRLRATLFLSTTAGEKLVGQRSIAVQGVAPSQDASGGVRALTEATDAAASDISEWLVQVARTRP